MWSRIKFVTIIGSIIVSAVAAYVGYEPTWTHVFIISGLLAWEYMWGFIVQVHVERKMQKRLKEMDNTDFQDVLNSIFNDNEDKK